MSPAKKKNLPEQTGGNSDRPDFRSYANALKAHQKKNSEGGAPSAGHGSDSGNSVEVVEKEGFIQKIKVTCKCGELIEIDCGYDDS